MRRLLGRAGFCGRAVSKWLISTFIDDRLLSICHRGVKSVGADPLESRRATCWNATNVRWFFRMALILLAALSLAACFSASAPSHRKATANELKTILASLRRDDHAVTAMASAIVSRSDPGWASIEDVGTDPRTYYLVHRSRDTWDIAYVFDVIKGNVDESETRSAYGGCAYAPTKVMHDLYGLTCPTWRGLHAREATRDETASMKAVYLTLGKKLPDDLQRQVHLGACVSRLDSSWAKAGVVFGEPEKGEQYSSAGSTLYFHREGAKWRIAIKKQPSHAIALSFTTCG